MFRFVFAGLFFTIHLISFSQTTDVKSWRLAESDSMQQGFILFENKNYLEALPIFEKIYKAHPSELFLKYCYGVSCLSRSDKHSEAFDLLKQVYKKNKRIENIEFFLAKASLLNYNFDDALKLLESANKNDTISLSEEQKQEYASLERYCLNSKKTHPVPTNATIINIGNSINTVHDEDIPLLTADESFIIFSKTDAKAENRDEISASGVYLSVKENENWLKPALINKGSAKDKAIALSPDGLTLYLYHQDSNNNGDIYSSEFDYFEWSIPHKLKGSVNSDSWEGSCSVSPNGKYLYFSSNRPGGFGGKDIYRATLQSDNTWGEVINLGESVNTAMDEDCPFIHANASTLFYSSKGRNSMGGYDIFQSTWKVKESIFSEGINLGFPVNTPDDNMYYTLSANGNNGFYASGKTGGEGLKDIYKVTNGYVGEKPTAYVVKGVVTKAINVLYSDITINLTTKDNQSLGEVKVNSVNGKYMAILPADSEVKLVYKYKAFEYKTIEINTSILHEIPDQMVEVFFDVKPELKQTQGAKDSVNIALQNFERMHSSRDKLKLFTQKYGNLMVEGLEFMVQIAAYKYPTKYEFKKLKKLGKITKLNLNDDITRFVIGGSFKTLGKAYEYSQKVINAGQKDAFVVVLYQGKRVFLEDLETLKIFPANN